MQEVLKLAQDEPKSFVDGIGIVTREIVEPSGLPAGSDPIVFLRVALLFILTLVGILSLGAFVWGAFRYMTSLGDETKAAAAKKVMLYAILGLGLVMGSFIIIQFVRIILGI